MAKTPPAAAASAAAGMPSGLHRRQRSLNTEVDSSSSSDGSSQSGGEGSTATNAEIYLRISLLGLPPMLMMLAGVGYLRGLQDTKRPLYVAAGTAALNLVIELVLIYGLDQGIGASALSTVIAQWLGAGVYCWWIARAVADHDVRLRPDWKIIGQLAGAGLDLLMRTAALRGGITVTVAVAARIGEADLNLQQVPDDTIAPLPSTGNLGSQVEDVQRQAIVQALKKTRYNKTAAAKLLGLSLRQLRYRIEKLGIE